MTKPQGPISYDGQPDWLDEVLASAERIPHKSPTLHRALKMFDEPITSYRLAYARFLDDALRVAVDYNRIVFQFSGVPVEAEFMSVYGERWAFIQQGTKTEASRWAVVFFDRNGVQMERILDSASDALNVMVNDGYVLCDRDAMFRISSEEAWLGGVQSSGLCEVMTLPPATLAIHAVQA